MISVAEAYAKIAAGLKLLPTEIVPIGEALGRVLAEPAAARVSMPPVAVSSMDGYALRAADTTPAPDLFMVIGESAAGRGFDGFVDTSQAVRIFTGAPMPRGADAVVMQENCEAVGEGRVMVKAAVDPAHFVRPAGMDFKQGAVLLNPGRILSARDIGLLASMNLPQVTVRRRPRVALLATGDELALPGEPLGPSSIINSNAFTLAAMVKVFGGEPIDLGIARDNEASLARLLSDLKGADLLVTMGGASVGDYDLVGKALGKEGFDLSFHKVAMKPGKPLIFGHIHHIPVLGVPGNPVSAAVTAFLFLRAALRLMQGLPAGIEPTQRAPLAEDLPVNGARQEYLRATLAPDRDGTLLLRAFSAQDSALMALLCQADVLIVRPPHAPAAKAGTLVPYLPFGQDLLSA